MKKVIFSQVMTDNGIAEFSGVYDRNGLPVKIILEADDDGIVLTAVRRKLTDIELMEMCNSVDGCESCIFQGDCDDEGGSNS